MTDPAQLSQPPEPLASDALSWLADAPLFIDSTLVSAFHDAILRPESAVTSMTVADRLLKTRDTDLSAEVEARLDLPKLIKWFPWLDAGISASGSAEVAWHKEEEKDTVTTYVPIVNPERKLVELSLHYAAKLPERTAFVRSDAFPGERWWEPTWIRESPRALLFIDVPRHRPFIPFAAELVDGGVHLIYLRLTESYAEPGDTLPPKYPGAESELLVAATPEERQGLEAKEEEARRTYFGWFEQRMRKKPNEATKVVEEVVRKGGGRVEWIDFRLPLGESVRSRTLHLHVSGRGQYGTGTFAYNLIQRGFKHGLRIVGTLKTEPDLNVLAIFEK